MIQPISNTLSSVFIDGCEQDGQPSWWLCNGSLYGHEFMIDNVLVND